MHPYTLTYTRYGECAILVQWPPEISTSVLHDVLHFKTRIANAMERDIVYVNHSYNSILILYRFPLLHVSKKIISLKELYESIPPTCAKQPMRLWKIPVCYDAMFAIDMEFLCTEKGMLASDVIRYHTQPLYTVYFIGFLPGFMYLGGIDAALHTPRRDAPRPAVVRGAVGIGGDQTGIYPCESPGGWHIIGNSPIRFFDPASSTPCFVHAGDGIKFYSISIEQHQHITRRVAQRSFEPEMELYPMST